jgi:hypothetical protein
MIWNSEPASKKAFITRFVSLGAEDCTSAIFDSTVRHDVVFVSLGIAGIDLCSIVEHDPS